MPIYDEMNSLQGAKTATASSTNSNHEHTAFQNAHNHQRPNSELTPEERLAKRTRKAQLKQATRRRKLVVSLQQAVQRRDHEFVAKTQAKLEQWDKEHGITTVNAAGIDTGDYYAVAPSAVVASNPLDAGPDGKLSIYIAPIEKIYNTLMVLLTKKQPLLGDETDHYSGKSSRSKHKEEAASLTKSETTASLLGDKNTNNNDSDDDLTQHREKQQRRLVESKRLLQNMSKGTQEVHMFTNNYDALCGYTRLKFSERSRLVADALARLDQVAVGGGNGSDAAAPQNINSCTDAAIAQRILDHLHTNNKIETVCSIGCGPGCDAVGVGVYLNERLSKNNDRPSSSRLRRAVLLDWAMSNNGWESITAPLSAVIVPSVISDEVVWGKCNVVKDWDHDENEQTRELLLRSSDDVSESILTLEADVIVTSYLLTETRGKWMTFYDRLLKLARPGTIFLFTEPTAWQLHILMQRTCSAVMDFCWLDSSMGRPDLQTLERRIGPAALIGIKRDDN